MAGADQIARGGPVRWPAIVAALTVGAVYLLLSDRLTLGPTWLPIVGVLLFLAPLTLARLRGRHRLAEWLGLILLVLMTALVAISAAFLVTGLPRRTTPASTLLIDAALIWLANVVVFALWYWEIDAGGPRLRHSRSYQPIDFIFPQSLGNRDPHPDWRPEFLDYLYLAFNFSTAFSPTDTLVLTHRAKALTMGQSIVSLVVVACLAARAINTL